MEGSVALSLGGQAGPVETSPGSGRVGRDGDAHDLMPDRAEVFHADAAIPEGATGEPRSAPAMVAPALVLTAAAAIAEGYGWLGMLRLSGREPSAVVFAALAVVLIAVLTRRRGGRRLAGAGLLVGAVLVLLGATLASLLVAGPVVAHVVGASALMYATVALGAAATEEHRSRWRANQRDPKYDPRDPPTSGGVTDQAESIAVEQSATRLPPIGPGREQLARRAAQPGSDEVDHGGIGCLRVG
jgi:hypothetical protein